MVKTDWTYEEIDCFTRMLMDEETDECLKDCWIKQKYEDFKEYFGTYFLPKNKDLKNYEVLRSYLNKFLKNRGDVCYE